MNPYCVDIKLDIPVFNPKVNLESFTKSYWNNVPKYDLNMEILRFLKGFGLQISKAELFYSEPNAFTPIHTDGAPEDMAKLNWVFGGENSTMNWYKPTTDKPVKISEYHTLYKGFELSEVELVHSQAVGTPSIVQVGVPHNATNGSNPRWCLCLILMWADQTRKERPTMGQVVELLSEYII